MPFMQQHLRPGPERSAALGLTLLEVLVVLALLGVLVGLAAPAVSRWQIAHQLQGQAEGFLHSLVLARSEALRRQQRISLCAHASAGTCDSNGQWQQGWLVFVDDNRNGLREAQELLLEMHEPLPPVVSVGATSTVRSYFSYGAEGRSQSASGAFMSGTWRFCSSSAPQGWKVVSNALGRPRIEKYTAQSCP